MREVYLTAAGEFYPEKIVDIFGSRRKQRYQRTDLQLLVRWSGYTEKDDSWVKYEEVKTSDVFIKYCQQNNFTYLLDKKEKARMAEIAKIA